MIFFCNILILRIKIDDILLRFKDPLRKEKIEIIKSENDPLNYRYIELENKIKCVLIQDEKTEISATVVKVGVGSLENPPDGLGYAHLLEHMLFLGIFFCAKFFYSHFI